MIRLSFDDVSIDTYRDHSTQLTYGNDRMIIKNTDASDLTATRGTLTDDGTASDAAIALDGDFYANGSDATGAIAGAAEGNFGSDPITDGVFADEN